MNITNEMFSRSVINRGNRERLAKLIKKAESGERITYVSLGGSITEGAAASSSDTCYASLIAKYLKKRFGEDRVDFVNAGIGATGSLIGVHRLSHDVLAFEPDLVTVEYSVNDNVKDEKGIAEIEESYDNLAFNLLNAPSKPAVLLIATMNGDTIDNCEDVHLRVAKHYDLPFVSLRRLIDREIESGSIVWREIAHDSLHPLDEGHAYIAGMVERFMDGISSSDAIEPERTVEQQLTTDIYRNAELVYAESMPQGSAFDFDATQIFHFPGTLVATSNGAPLSLTFENCRRAYILYMRTPSENAGSATVCANGNEYKIDASFEGGWGAYAQVLRVFDADKAERLEMTVSPTLGCGEELRIFGIMKA